MSALLLLPEVGVRVEARRLAWEERIGLGYRLEVEATMEGAPAPEAILGRPASVAIGARGGERTLSGVVTRALHRAGAGHEETLVLSVEPVLAPLAHRADVRIFEHRTTPEIAADLLAEWNISPHLRIDAGDHPKHEYRVQYEESCFAFLRRVLEEEGICLVLEPTGDGPERVVLDDAPASRNPSAELAHADRLESAAGPAYAKLERRHELAPSTLTLLDHDFSRRADAELAARASAEAVHPALPTRGREPGAFFLDGKTPEAGARSDEARGRRVAERRLAAARAASATVEFRTNVPLHAGAVVRLDGQPRPVLVTSIRATYEDGEIDVRVSSADTRSPFFPPLSVPRPRAFGVQPARVAGPEGQEVHVDEHGRVRVEFLWDAREGRAKSSAWVRVSQGWAGPGLGLVAVPRVGQGVLVGFMDGNPDLPVVVGRLFDGASPHPFPLPRDATKTGLRTSTSPGGEGYSELSFEDAKGRELVYLRAERDREALVRADDRLRVDGSRDKAVGGDEAIAVSGSRGSKVGRADTIEVGERFTAVVAGGSTYIDMSQGKIRMTTGAASLELDGADARIVTEGSVSVGGRTTIRVEAGAEVHIETKHGDVVIQGGPLVRLNPRDADGLGDAFDVANVPVPVPAEIDLVASLDDATDLAGFDPDAPRGIGDKLAPGGAWDFLGRGEAWRAFHFFHAGAASRAAGQPLGVAMRQEGQRYEARFGRSSERGDPGNGLWGGKAPYGMPREDAETFEKGAAFYDAGSRQA